LSSPIQLIVGLANPGKEYANTRHNAGAWFIHAIANAANISLRAESKYHGLHGLIELHGQKCHLLIPTTYMNNSGRAVSACLKYLKITPDSLLIVHDEIDLPVGTIKLKFDGGNGGHNGLKDVIEHIHTKQFYRLRIGIGRPTHSKDVIDYVLENPSKADKKIIIEAMQRADKVLPLILNGEMQKAMQQLHS